jgi:predicted lipid-binding transport protein (Tim44 family)
MIRIRSLLALVAVAAALSFVAVEADARAGRGSSFGSRGANTYKAPPATNTAPNQARPIERSMTQPGQPSTAAARQVGTPAAATPGLAGRGGFLGGLLGAGLLGMLLGYGLAGGLGSLASFLGLLLQVGLIVLVAGLLWRWWQSRQQRPAYAGMPRQMNESHRRVDLGGAGGATGAVPGMTTPGVEDGVSIDKDDYDDFERLLGDIQTAYANQDLGALRERVTPEMLSYFAEELAHDTSRGVVNQISDVKLLQGDLAEAWREGDTQYATVAMRFSLVERFVERASGRVVEGGDQPVEVTELWTFLRSRGGAWLLSAIQQA